MRKCQTCRSSEAISAWQPFGPGERPDLMMGLGGHYRGFPALAVCDSCARAITAAVEHPTTAGGFIFTYRKQGYYVLGHDVRPAPF